MVRVTGSSGKIVEVDITGVTEVAKRLRLQRKRIENATDRGVILAGAFIEDEVKESIAGLRTEPRSVDTGRLGNSIQFTKIGKAVGVVKPKKVRYPGGGNTQQVATLLEFGTSRIPPRRHFRNTEKRNKKKVRDIINQEIKIGAI